MWRSKVSPKLRKYLNKEVRASLQEVKAIKTAKKKSNAQLWCAIAHLSKQIDELNNKLLKLEAKKKNNKKLEESLNDM